jgi:hypothetical protein
MTQNQKQRAFARNLMSPGAPPDLKETRILNERATTFPWIERVREEVVVEGPGIATSISSPCGGYGIV